jgi:hypothetical protein
MKTKQKSNKRLMAESITKETKREGQGKAKRCIAYKNQKREKACSRKLFHPWPL